MGKILYLAVISMLPVVELRGGIPVGLFDCKMSWYSVYMICVIANMIPVPFIVLFGEKILQYLKKIKCISGMVEKYEQKTAQKADKIRKYVMAGLFLFVAVPLPGTGAWTGAVIAAVLDMKMKDAILSIFCGVLVAGIIVTLMSTGVSALFSLA